MSDPGEESPLVFPCRFPIKAMGRDDPDFRERVLKTIAAHASFDHDEDVRMRPSRNGRFISITVTIKAGSREQLDSIYEALQACESVIMAL